MTEINPTDADYIAGTHAITRPGLFDAYADRIDQFLNGLEAGWLTDGALPETVRMALTSVRTGLDILGGAVESAACTSVELAGAVAP